MEEWNYMIDDEIKLIIKASEGDRQAMDALFEKEHDRFYLSALNSMNDSDMAEEVLNKVEEYAFNHFEELDNLQNFEKWIEKLIVRFAGKCKSDSEHSAEPDADIDLPLDERQNIVQSSLDCLDDMEQTILLMYGYDHKTVGEISTELHLSKEETAKLLSSAEKKISAFIEKNGASEKYKTASLPFFFMLLDGLHPEKAVNHVVEPVQIISAKADSYKEEIIDKGKTVIPEKITADTVVKTASAAGMPTAAKIALAVVAAGAGVTGVVAAVHHQSTNHAYSSNASSVVSETADSLEETNVYESALTALYNSQNDEFLILPDGTDNTLHNDYPRQYSFQYALADGNGDGTDELLVSAMDNYGAGGYLYVYTYDDGEVVNVPFRIDPQFKEDDAEYYESADGFLGITSQPEFLYDSGIIEITSAAVGYTVSYYQYNTEAGSYYQEKQMVECKGTGCLDNFYSTDLQFPDDSNETVMVVFDPGVIGGVYKNATIMSQDELNAYENSLINGGNKIELNWLDLIPANIYQNLSSKQTKETIGYDTSGYVSIMNDSSVLLSVSPAVGWACQYGEIVLTEDNPLDDLGDIYAAKNQTLYQPIEYDTEQEAKQAAAAKQAAGEGDFGIETLKDEKYALETPVGGLESSAIWTGDIYIRKDTVVNYTEYDTANEMKIRKADELESYIANQSYIFSARIDSIDENGLISELTVIDGPGY